MEATMKIIMIAAIGNQGQLGLNGIIPWDLPEDRAIFRDTIKGKHAIVGYNTYSGIAKLLPLCTTYLINNKDLQGSRTMINTAIKHAKRAGISELFVVGGGRLYKELMPIADMLYISHVAYDGVADVFFPEIEPDKWDKEILDSGDQCTYSIYHRINT